MSEYGRLPDDLPVPSDDGAARPGRGVALDRRRSVAPVRRGRWLLVAYAYPLTGAPGRPLPHGWDDIPGARGCTPQSCAYRDALAEFERHGAAVVGTSAQSAAEQAEFAAREHIHFPLAKGRRIHALQLFGSPWRHKELQRARVGTPGSGSKARKVAGVTGRVLPPWSQPPRPRSAPVRR